jgi:hypothetical protein
LVISPPVPVTFLKPQAQSYRPAAFLFHHHKAAIIALFRFISPAGPKPRVAR